MTLFDDAVERMGKAFCGVSRGPCECTDGPGMCNDIRDEATAAINALLALLAERGLKVVPMEATAEMIAAAKQTMGSEGAHDCEVSSEDIVSAALAAAPDVWGK